MILIKIEKCGHCFYCIYHDIIEYCDNFLDNNREIIVLISPNPIMIKTNMVPGHFAERHFAERTFRRRTFCWMDVLPNWHFAEQTFYQTDNLPKIEMLFRQNAWDWLIPQLCNSQPLCKITIIWSLAVNNGQNVLSGKCLSAKSLSAKCPAIKHHKYSIRI
jgi:hypothetical protein